ncbi:uncharacterized protein LOC134832035 [Culicoides brevitarsis]|uniref:uncharacterized protein LOC134832035 n=1 Tax=Culicoides brevitarsis TaxID=469753 RepID=UPI00307BF5AE
MKIFAFFVLLSLIGVSKVNSQAAAPNPFTPQQIQCIRNCPRIANYNPVCGTDNFQYENSAHLRCAQRCGYNVQAAFNGRCEPFLNPPRNQQGVDNGFRGFFF